MKIDGTDSEFRNVGNKNSDAGDLPKKEQITQNYKIVVLKLCACRSIYQFVALCLLYGYEYIYLSGSWWSGEISSCKC